MHSLPITALVVISTLFGFAWHNKPAREPERRATEPETFVPRSNKSSHLNWDMLAIWSFVVVSFTALFFTGYVIWAKCRGS